MTTSTRAQKRAARLDDPRFESVRTPRARRRLAGALVALLVVEGVLFVLLERAPVAGIAGLAVVALAFVVCLGALKASTRGVEELPAEALDERQWQLRGEAYARSYRIGFGLLTEELALVVLWLAAGWPAPGTGLIAAAVVLPFHVGLVLPTMVAAASDRV